MNNVPVLRVQAIGDYVDPDHPERFRWIRWVRIYRREGTAYSEIHKKTRRGEKTAWKYFHDVHALHFDWIELDDSEEKTVKGIRRLKVDYRPHHDGVTFLEQSVMTGKWMRVFLNEPNLGMGNREEFSKLFAAMQDRIESVIAITEFMRKNCSDMNATGIDILDTIDEISNTSAKMEQRLASYQKETHNQKNQKWPENYMGRINKLTETLYQSTVRLCQNTSKSFGRPNNNRPGKIQHQVWELRKAIRAIYDLA